MNTRMGTIILAVVCVGLVVALLATKKQANDRQKTDATTILDFSNQLVTASDNIRDLGQVNLVLSNSLDASRQETVTLSNQVSETSGKLADTEASLKASQTQLAALEAETQALDQKVLALTNTITSLNSQIDETQKKLAATEGDKTFLENELKRLTAQKEELERRFNDLAVVRAQVRKLRDELAISRRLEWIREGILAASEKKGAQVLMERASTNRAVAAAGAPSNYDLNVEVHSDGSVRVLPPATNAPAPVNPPSP